MARRIQDRPRIDAKLDASLDRHFAPQADATRSYAEVAPRDDASDLPEIVARRESVEERGGPNRWTGGGGYEYEAMADGGVRILHDPKGGATGLVLSGETSAAEAILAERRDPQNWRAFLAGSDKVESDFDGARKGPDLEEANDRMRSQAHVAAGTDAARLRAEDTRDAFTRKMDTSLDERFPEEPPPAGSRRLSNGLVEATNPEDWRSRPDSAGSLSPEVIKRIAQSVADLLRPVGDALKQKPATGKGAPAGSTLADDAFTTGTPPTRK